MPTYFIFAPGCLPGGLKPPIRITYFEFNEQSQGLKFADTIEIELRLMRKLLQAGYKKVNGVYPGTDEESREQQRLVDERDREAKQKISDMTASMERLRQQNEALKEKEDSPPQSPKGSLAPRDFDVIDTDNTPIELGRHLAKGTSRRLSEPQPYTGTLGAGLDISPMRPSSGSKAIPIKDPKTKMQITPTKSCKRTSFTLDDTIHEETENED